MRKLELYKARKIVETTLKNGGYTFDKHYSGYMVSLDGSERKIKTRDNTRSDIAYRILEFFNRYNTVNTWFDEDDINGYGTIYLDVSVNIKDKDLAIAFARRNNQLAIYDCCNKQTITIA